ncbi:SH3 domain-containing protein [Gilvimarinus sp. F26214L]|uniref:SH3 domain-containing protein n=1 Tax=Gilvimarinus sp. DZF01 TaxID=3461371 RepID=UPI004045754F
MNAPYRVIVWTTALLCSTATIANADTDNSTEPEPARSAEVRENGEADENIMRLLVIDPYAEMRTGPGRGYPVFYAVEQGESIEVITRRPGWFEIRSQNGQRGWTTTAELSRTMQASGEPADLPSVSYGDYLARSWRAGLKSGRFTGGELDDSDTFSATAGYRLYSWLGLELELGKVFGSDTRGQFYGFNAFIEPFSHWPVSPFVTAGLGTIDIDSQPKLVPLDIDSSDYETYSFGGHYYLGRNFVVQGSYRWFRVDVEDSTERLESWSVGFSAFF